MATITLQTVAGATYQDQTTITADEATRLINGLRTHFGMPTATAAEIHTQWARALWAHTKRMVREAEDVQAKSANADIAFG